MWKTLVNRASSIVKKRNSMGGQEKVQSSSGGKENEKSTLKPVAKKTSPNNVKKSEERPHHIGESEIERNKIHDPDEPDIDKVVVKQGERPDPAAKCAAIVVADEFKGHLDLTDYDFSKVDSYARATPSSKTDSVKHLAEYLIAPWNNELDRLRSLFIWITENISYDAKAYFEGNFHHNGPEDTLRTRKGVCEGYAGLFDALASVAGLKVWKISGKAKGVGYNPGTSIDGPQYAHAWNGVLYKGEFLLIDSTWGAGILNGQHFERRFEPFYFLCKPTQFIYSHLPDDPKQQYVSPPLTQDEFLDLTFVKPQFFVSGLQFRNHYGNVIVTGNDQLEVEIARFSPDKGKPLHAVLEWKGKSIPVMVQRLVGYGDGSGGRVYKLNVACPSAGEGKLEIYVMIKGNSGPLVSSLKVINKGTGSHHLTYVKTFSVPFSYTIHTPIHSKLHLNKPDAKTKFEFSIFDLPEDEHPTLSLFTPAKQIRHLEKVSRCDDGSVTYALETCVDQKGEWNLVHSEKNSSSFNFIAQYVAE
ncbi:12343_t:CDS:2 [Acaulospora morrowiae]|uniref:12343_t:CDS:1 n=1 Tax=Acaulospora morrowiae TaxID=94023 RepID=A0A9N8Z3Y2_9GLOM|nr:12343_t:CDS:2 [Acaulospora morrowiae]